MLMHNVPWQWAITMGVMNTIASGVLLLISFVLGIFGWLPYVALLLQLASLVIIVSLIPLFMNLSREFFKWIFVFLLVHVFMTVLTCSLYYRRDGILDEHGTTVTALKDCFYFSLNTWTTVGAADLRVQPSLRLFSSCEALIGLVTFAIIIAMVWLWCTENMIPKELALFDGMRRNRKGLVTQRMRIRTFTGKDRELGKEWVDPPILGVSYRHDPLRGEWVPVEKPSDVKEDDLLLEPENPPAPESYKGAQNPAKDVPFNNGK